MPCPEPHPSPELATKLTRDGGSHGRRIGRIGVECGCTWPIYPRSIDLGRLLTWAASGQVQRDSALDQSRPAEVSMSPSNQSAFLLWPVVTLKMISLWQIAWVMNCRDRLKNLSESESSLLTSHVAVFPQHRTSRFTPIIRDHLDFIVSLSMVK